MKVTIKTMIEGRGLILAPSLSNGEREVTSLSSPSEIVGFLHDEFRLLTEDEIRLCFPVSLDPVYVTIDSEDDYTREIEAIMTRWWEGYQRASRLEKGKSLPDWIQREITLNL